MNLESSIFKIWIINSSAPLPYFDPGVYLRNSFTWCIIVFFMKCKLLF